MLKTRDDFIQSVWEKSEKAMAEERKKKARRRQAGGLAASAACLALVIGITSAGGAQEFMEHLRGGASSDGAAIVKDIEMQNTSDAATGETVSSPTAQLPEGSDITDADSADDMEVSYDGALPGASKLSNEELQEELRKGLEDAEKSKDSDFLAYYCLPVGIRIEDSNGNMLADGQSEEEVMQYMKWFYSLPEDQILTDEEFNSLKEIPTGYYKFTMELSWGADTEGADIAYWIVGDVSLP